ncbi:TonB-dependent receptor [Agrobacterium vitis]|uniref:TonB-dependent receptor n=1 Tax=Agrobacterium vitis TaxID=373 RepID=A0AAE2RCG7_AGRVI|nr:TonB-dependent receptor [Agrobacterium vitis]MBF2714135.1 TonB-dependent receptor [Agrobacterium vitis]MUO81514.1 TonB-dependent receptor [Agrobacterium vitis]MUO95839.1 TonB-dependent receptor [Agrobacterium vitis]MVA93918.1 TonB-dependent receptor [Agrobacterium vitis]MVB03575.1 TonB-dependent receptor [Agrobacterium vitis]
MRRVNRALASVGTCGLTLIAISNIVCAQDSSKRTDRIAQAKQGNVPLSESKNCPSSKTQKPGAPATDGCPSNFAAEESTPAQGPGGFGGPPQTGALPPPPRRMTISPQTFDAGPPLAGPAAINGVGPIFILPPGLVGDLKPGQTLLGFSDVAKLPPSPDGFTHKGIEIGAMGGSFGRYRSTLQIGQSNDNFAAYLAGSKIKDPGWRDHANSDLEELYGDLGWRDGTSSLHLTFSQSNSSSAGGPTPIELLANDRGSSWLWPNDRSDETRKIELSGEHQTDNGWTLSGKTYYGYTSRQARQTEGALGLPCADDPSTLCGVSGAYLDTNGSRYPLYATSGRYGFFNELEDKTNAYGVSFKAQTENPLFDRPNNFVIGASFDASDTSASVSRTLGELTTDLGFTNRQNTYQYTSVKSEAKYFSLYMADQLSVTDRLTVGATLRYNLSNIERYDGSSTNISYDYSLNDNRTFQSLNPSLGLTYKVTPDLVGYAGWNRENRAPTPFGTMCANVESACAFSNYFIADEPLDQVRYDNLEIGLRGQNTLSGEATLSWNIRLFSKHADNDLWLVQREERPMFTNVGETWRRGIQLGAALQSGPWNVGLDYILQKSTFEEEFSFYSPENPAADASRNITVPPGSEMPNIPNQVLNFSVDYALNERLNVGGIVTAVAGTYAFNDENNQLQKSDPYAVFSINARYKVSDHFELFGLVSNVFDTQYDTIGALLPVSRVEVSSVPGASNPISYIPGDPRTFYVGMRATF